MKQSEKLWICTDCGSVFGTPWVDPNSKKKRCVICGSSYIEIQKTVVLEIKRPRKSK